VIITTCQQKKIFTTHSNQSDTLQPMTAFDTLWFWRGLRLNQHWYETAKYTSDAHPHPYLLTGCPRPEDDSMRAFTSINNDGNLVITNLLNFPEAPPLWFVYAKGTIGIVDMGALSAYADTRFAEGTVLTTEEARKHKVSGKDRVGAISWVSPTNVMQQITVDENWRRRKISTLLIGAADTVIIASGDNTFLTGGEFTTGDGEHLRNVWKHSLRVIDRRGEIA
jgi:hypothetical protein